MRTPLKAFQQGAVRAAVQTLSHTLRLLSQEPDAAGRRQLIHQGGFLLLEAPTGIGKTLIAAHIAEQLSRKQRVVWFWITPFAGLVDQTARALRSEGFSLRVRRPEHDRTLEDSASGDLFLSTWASGAVVNAETRKIRREGESMPSLDGFVAALRASGLSIGVIIDEAHHSFRTGTQAMEFYRDVLAPEITVLVTATPRDQDILAFQAAVNGPTLRRVAIARSHGVDAGLLKKGVRVGLLRVPDQSQGQLINFGEAALRCGVATHTHLKRLLEEQDSTVKPLLLVQVDSDEGSVAKAVETLGRLGLPAHAIRTHTAAEPDPDLSALAHDDEVEALVFKMAIATGFDAPRAFTLVSLRSGRDPDFGVQIVGRLMRVDRRLQNAALPEALQHGYVFLSDHSRQQGLLDAAGRINAIQDELSSVSPSINVQSLDLVPEKPEERVPAEPGQASHPALPQTFAEAWGLLPSRPPAPGPETYSGTPLRTWPSRGPRQGDGMPRGRIERPDVPAALLRAVLSPEQRDLLREIADLFTFDDDLIDVTEQNAARILLDSTEVFSGARSRPEELHARAAQEEIDRQAQRTLLDLVGDGLLDVRGLYQELQAALRRAYLRRGMTEAAESSERLKSGLHKILTLRPTALRRAILAASGRHLEVIEAAPLPHETDDPGTGPARLNLYGIFPSDLNTWERKFAELLDNDPSGAVAWWHRNPVRRPHSVAVPLPGQRRQSAYFPDFAVGVPARRRTQGIALIEIKRDLNDEQGDARAKVQVEHPVYREIIMLHQDKNHDWRIVEYDPHSDRNVLGSVFKVEMLRH